MDNSLKIGNLGKPVTSDLSTITIGDERTSLEIAQVDKGARIRGDLEVTGNIKGSITATDLTLDDITADDITCHDILIRDGQLDIQHDRSGVQSLFKVESGTEAGDGTYTGAKIATDGNSLWTCEGGLTFAMTNNNDLNFDDVIIFENDGDRGAYISTDCNITNTSTNTFYVCKIDLDKTGASTSNNTIFGIDLDMDNTTATSGTNTMYGIRNTPTLTHAADAGTPSIYGLMQTVTGHTNGGAVGTGIFNVVTGSDTNRGFHQRVDDTGIDIILESSANASDECQISTVGNGATKIETIDADASLAHFTLDVDGDIILDSETGEFIMKKAGTEFSSANSAYAGMILGYTRIQNDGTVSADNQITIGTAMTVLQTNHGTNVGVTFTVPPSGNVEIVCSCYLNVSNKTVDFALSSGTTFSEVADMHTYDAGSNYSVDSHREFATIPFAVTGLTSGDELTYYIAASSSASSAYINHGNFRTTGLHYPPILVKAIALPTTITTGE